MGNMKKARGWMGLLLGVGSFGCGSDEAGIGSSAADNPGTAMAPALRLPENGRSTGSVWAENARQPRFAWAAVSDATYEFQIDDSCTPTHFDACEFSSPEWTATGLTDNEVTPPSLPVSENAPVGRRYFWRVRSCTDAACSPWSQIRYVDVGRQRSDFDGDGYADVVVTNSGSVQQAGRVRVGFGPEPARRSVILADTVAPEPLDHFGTVAEPLGDLDADGFADLLVTSPGGSDSESYAVVYFGSADFSRSEAHANLRVSGVEAGDTFGGVAVPTGDVDADGQQDFVIGFGRSSRSAQPRLYRGSGRSVMVTELPIVRTGERANALSAGDVNGDGHADLLATSVAGIDDEQVRNDLLHGTPGGFGTAMMVEEHDYPGVPGSIAGDVTGDGIAELGWSVEWRLPSGRIAVSSGASAPESTPAMMTWASGLDDLEQLFDLAPPRSAGDVNGDGIDDALVEVSIFYSDLMRANLYLGGRDSRSAPDAAYASGGAAQLVIATGSTRRAGDVNGDGFDDVLLVDDHQHTGTLFFGGFDLDPEPDAVLELP